MKALLEIDSRDGTSYIWKWFGPEKLWSCIWVKDPDGEWIELGGAVGLHEDIDQYFSCGDPKEEFKESKFENIGETDLFFILL